MISSERKQKLERIISDYPRVSLANLPTPLQEASRLSEKLGGPKIYFKRDDLTGLAFGGNKLRMFEFELAEALQQGADVIVSSSVVQSNLLRQLAAASAKLGLESRFLVSKIPPNKELELQGNLLLDLTLGANVRLIEGGFDELKKARKSLAEKLENEGRKVYIPYGDYIYLSVIGYINCAIELFSQLDNQGVFADNLYLASSQVTQAGLMFGSKYLKSDISICGFVPEHWRIDTAPSRIAELANAAGEKLGLEAEIASEDVNSTGSYTGEYGLVTEGCLEAIKLVARTEGILLDPTYTGKAMAGLIDHIRRGKFDRKDSVVFLHTGGTPALFAYSEQLRKIAKNLES